MPYITSDLLTNDEPQELPELPKSLIIVGGGYIALELGQMFRRFGTDVTILVRSGQLLAHNYEPELGEELGRVFKKEDIQVLNNVLVESARQEGNSVVVAAKLENARREKKKRWQISARPNGSGAVES